MKKTLLISAIALSIVSLYAEEYHGFSIDALAGTYRQRCRNGCLPEAYRLAAKPSALQKCLISLRIFFGISRRGPVEDNHTRLNTISRCPRKTTQSRATPKIT